MGRVRKKRQKLGVTKEFMEDVEWWRRARRRAGERLAAPSSYSLVKQTRKRNWGSQTLR